MRKGRQPSASVVCVRSGGACGVSKACPPARPVIGEAECREPCGCHLREPAAGVVGVGDVKDSGASHLTILAYEGIYSLFPNLFWKFSE